MPPRAFTKRGGFAHRISASFVLRRFPPHELSLAFLADALAVLLLARASFSNETLADHALAQVNTSAAMQYDDHHHDSEDAIHFAAFDREFEAWRKSWLEGLIDDYGMLSHYRAANARLKQTTARENSVVFFGDSITEGWSLEEHFPGKPFINRGICAQTTPQMLLRFRQDVVLLKPKAVIMLAGINDIGGNTGPMAIEDSQANYASMVDIAEANAIRVIVSSLLPPSHPGTLISRYNVFKHPPQRILDFNLWLKALAAAHDCPFVNYFDAMKDDNGFIKESLSEDGLHPTAAGYKIMTLEATIRLAQIFLQSDAAG